MNDTKPTIRVRINHGHTARDGWKVTETTVDYSGEGIDWPVLVEAMRRGHTEGALEASVRNRIETGLSEVAA